ncbi:MAG: N-acetyltransferase [Candidatus Thorarchaeota archaeon]|nr:MAG: N-acetyltransferase [Candidatus Thorarchaeota archaeon]
MLESKKIRLTLLEEHHLEDIIRGWNNPEMRKFLGGFIPHTKEAEREWIQSAQQQKKNMSSYYFVIEDLSTSRFIGTVSLNAINWLSKSSGYPTAT